MGYDKVEIKNEKELIEFIEDGFKKNRKKKVSDVLDNLGITDTALLINDELLELFELYQFYRTNPTKPGLDYRWAEAYNIISRTEESQKPRMF